MLCVPSGPIATRPMAARADGKHCGEEFKQVGANELLQHLKDGWEIKHDLPNGEVIVCKEGLNFG